MGRSSVVGPALGGVICYSIPMKRNGQAGARDEGGLQTPVPCRIVAVSILGDNGTTATMIKTATGNTFADIGQTETLVNNGGDTATPSHGVLGTPVATVQPFVESVTGARDAARGSAITLNNAGTQATFLEDTAQVFVVPTGHPYDADQPVSPNQDDPYFSSND